MAAPAVESTLEGLRFMTPEQALKVQSEVGTPAFVYDEATLQQLVTIAPEGTSMLSCDLISSMMFFLLALRSSVSGTGSATAA